jgi:hypothetical protein
VVQLIFEVSSLLLACDLMTDTGLSCRRCEVGVVVNDHSSSREACVRTERSSNESMSECNKRLTHRKRHRHLGLESRGVMREVRPNKESRNGTKQAAGLGEAKISASMILQLPEPDGNDLKIANENDFVLGGTECDKGGASGSPTHIAVVDNEDVAHTRKSIGFDISEAGVGIAIEWPGRCGY